MSIDERIRKLEELVNVDISPIQLVNLPREVLISPEWDEYTKMRRKHIREGKPLKETLNSKIGQKIMEMVPPHFRIDTR